MNTQTTRRKLTPEFKAKVVIEALREQSTLVDIAKKYEITQAQLSRWKKEFLANAAAAFGGSEQQQEMNKLAIASHGKPEIINSDQGSQYTCPTWEKACEGIRMSMDGRRRCLDNVWIERFWRTIKREYVYINPTDNVKELREGIKNYIEYYNTKRPHQGIEQQIPMTKYAKIAA